MFLPLEKKAAKQICEEKKPAPFFAAGRMHQRRAQFFFLSNLLRRFFF